MNKVRILFIHHGKGIGGAPTSMIQLINALNKNLYQVKVLFIYDTPILTELCEENHINYRILDSWFFRNIYIYWAHTDAKLSFKKNISFKIFLLNVFSKFRKLISYPIVSLVLGRNIIKSENPDIVHLNTLFLTDWLIASKFVKKKTIVHIREPLSFGRYGIRKSIIRFLLNKYGDRLITISKDYLERISLYEKTTLFYNSVNLKDVQKERKDKSNDGKFYLAYLGGSRIIKGINLIFEFCDNLPNNIIIYMAGVYFGDYKEKIEKKKNLKYIGPVKNPLHIISISDALIFPAIVPHFPKPVIEAFSLSKPAIASDVKGNDEIIKNYVNGILFKSGDSKDLLNSILYFYRNREKCIEFGAQGYKFIKEYFDIEKNINIIEKIYREI